MNLRSINAILVASLGTINVSCTTTRITVDDHSYRHNDHPPVINIVNKNENHNTNKDSTPSRSPSTPQSDKDFLQYQQSAQSSLEPSSYKYPPIPSGGGLYYPVRTSL